MSGNRRNYQRERDNACDGEGWWPKQRQATAKLSAALRAAGIHEGVVTTPGTDAPREVRAPSEGRIRSNAAGWSV